MRLILIGGDGEQAWFGAPIELEKVDRGWFNSHTERGQGTLVQVVSGPHAGKYIALTSKVTASIEDQLASLGQASVVVNVIRRAANFRPGIYGLDAVGMGFVELAI